METLLQDARYGLRMLRKNPGFSATVVLTLALAVGVAATVFSVIDAVLIRPLPYDNPEKIFVLATLSPQGYGQPASYPEYLDWRRYNTTFSALAAFNDFRSANFEGPSGVLSLPRIIASDNFFDVFGVKPMLGRTFAPGEDQPGKNDVAVLSYEVWRQHFGGQRNAIGQTIRLDGQPYTVVGVMPAGFRYPVGDRNAIYTPLYMDKQMAEGRGAHWLPIVARLKAGISREQAEANLNRVFDDLGRLYPETNGRRVNLRDISSFVVGNSDGPLKVLILAVLAILAIGCINIAGLLLARGVKREREVALRSALGATRLRIVRQMLAESMVLAILGAMGGTALSVALFNATRALLISAVARGGDVQINSVALLVALTLAVLTTLLAGLMPALRLSGTTPNLALKASGPTGSSRGQHRLRAAFIVAQMALALVLLVVSGLLLRVLAGLRSTDLGFDADHLLTTEIDLSSGSYERRDPVASFYQPLLEKVGAIPGVKAAGLIQILPIQNWGSNSDIRIVGHHPSPLNQEQLAEIRAVTPGYFSAMGISLVRGRMLDERFDTPTSPPVAVVNEVFVKKFFAKDEDPIGKQIDDGPKTLIVGVIRSIRQNLYEPPLAEMDWSVSQLSSKNSLSYFENMHLVVRSASDPQVIIPSLRSIFHNLDPGLPFRQPETMQEVVADALVFQRLENWLFGTFGALAVLLAIVGLYGLVSHEVELSIRDIGRRMALGATRMRVLAAVYRRVALVLLVGVTLGLLVTIVVHKLVSAVVVIHAGKDANTIFFLAVGLFALGLLAVLLPASRAASVDPMVALRYE